LNDDENRNDFKFGDLNWIVDCLSTSNHHQWYFHQQELELALKLLWNQLFQ